MGLFQLDRAYDDRGRGGEVIGGPFALSDPSGRVVTERDFQGRFMLIYFGYSFCPDVCPTTLATIVQALARLGPEGDAIQPIFITVDPARDTPAVLGRYVATFSPRLIGLTGTPAQLRAVEAAYHVVVTPQAGAGGEEGAIDHSAVLYLMGPEGRFITALPTTETPAALAEALRRAVGRPAAKAV